LNPQTSSQLNSSVDVSFQFNASSSSTFVNTCNFILNGRINSTKNNINSGSINTISLKLNPGNYIWQVNCTNNGLTSSSDKRTIVIVSQTSPLPPTQVDQTNHGGGGGGGGGKPRTSNSGGGDSLSDSTGNISTNNSDSLERSSSNSSLNSILGNKGGGSSEKSIFRVYFFLGLLAFIILLIGFFIYYFVKKKNKAPFKEGFINEQQSVQPYKVEVNDVPVIQEKILEKNSEEQTTLEIRSLIDRAELSLSRGLKEEAASIYNVINSKYGLLKTPSKELYDSIIELYSKII
jgi:hypothetical protein